MIEFTNLKYKNFLSTGNVFTELKLNATSSTLVIGANGNGKSTMLDAICFVLFGRGFRDVNKGQLVNSINKKDCVVEIEFNIGTKQYKIIRGIKPNIFEIWVDGILIDQAAASKDYQEFLEDTILKLNYKSFTQIVILGTASFVPFMQLPAASRREIIENILDIRIFSTMRELASKQLAILKVDSDNAENSLKLITHKAKIQYDYIKTLENDQTERIKDINLRMLDAEGDIRMAEMHLGGLVDDKETIEDIIKAKKNELQNSIVSERTRLKDEILQENVRVAAEVQKSKNVFTTTSDVERNTRDNELARTQKRLDEIEIEERQTLRSKSQYEGNLRQFELEGKGIAKEQEFYIDHDSCEVCKQNIDAKFKEEILTSLEVKMKESFLKIKLEIDKVNLMEITLDDLRRDKALVEIERVDINGRYIDAENTSKLILEASIKESTEKSSKIIDALNKQLQELSDTVASQIDSLMADMGPQLNDVVNEISKRRAEIDVTKKNIAAMKKERDSLNSKTGNIDDEKAKLKEFALELKELEKKRGELNEEKQYLEISVALLKDSGIKTKVIEKYLPSINLLVNKYLKAMDFFAQFELDKEFKEVIKSRFRDEFSYESFSQGEKQRIDLALVFTWREIAKMKNSTNTNLLILDEVFDSSLDEAGTEYLTGLLNTLGEKQNVWIISHKKEELADKFNRTLRFIKHNNFSMLEEA